MADKTETRSEVGGKYLRYMNMPLVREGNTICYGDMSDRCFLIPVSYTHLFAREILLHRRHAGVYEKKAFVVVRDKREGRQTQMRCV